MNVEAPPLLFSISADVHREEEPLAVGFGVNIRRKYYWKQVLR